jgi:hypothetical protein
MAAYQTGGLAAVTEEEEEFFSPAAVTGTEEIIEEVKPDPMAELRKMATMTKEDAMARLRESRNTLAQRRTKQEKRAEQDRWLALAQGMLAPTRTGAFGENVGMAAEQLRGANALTFEQEQAIAEEEERLLFREYEIAGDYFDSLANLEGFKSTSRARVVSSITVMDPRDQEKIDAGDMRASEGKRVSLSTVMMPNGDTHSEIETVDDIPYEEGGVPYTIVDPRKVPAQAAAQKTAEQIALEASKTQFQVAKRGMDAIPMVTRLQRAYTLLQGLDEDTSGLNEKMRQVAQWAGISEIITDNVDLATLHKMFGAQILQDLRLLTGSKTDFEYTKVEQQNARLGASVAENMGIIDEHMYMLNEMVDKGEYAAQRMSTGPGTEEKGFMLEQYLRHRKAQAEAAASYDEETRRPPDSRLEELIENIQLNQGNVEEQKFHIDAFQEHYDIPDEIKLELRKLGAGI